MKTDYKPSNYFDLNVNQRINCKGNAEILYTTYKPVLRLQLPHGHEILKRISKRDSAMFTPGMLLNKNTICI